MPPADGYPVTMSLLADSGFWRAVSTALFVLFVVSFFVGRFSIPQWGWYALILSGVTFAVELLLLRSGR